MIDFKQQMDEIRKKLDSLDLKHLNQKQEIIGPIWDIIGKLQQKVLDASKGRVELAKIKKDAGELKDKYEKIVYHDGKMPRHVEIDAIFSEIIDDVGAQNRLNMQQPVQPATPPASGAKLFTGDQGKKPDTKQKDPKASAKQRG